MFGTVKDQGQCGTSNSTRDSVWHRQRSVFVGASKTGASALPAKTEDSVGANRQGIVSGASIDRG